MPPRKIQRDVRPGRLALLAQRCLKTAAPRPIADAAHANRVPGRATQMSECVKA